LATFPKSERLQSKKSIDTLFVKGNSFSIGCIKCIYFFLAETVEPKSRIEVLIGVSRKLHKTAVARNLLKRRIKEAYRLNKTDLIEALLQKNNHCHIAFIYNAKQIHDFKTIESKIILILQRLEKENETRD